MRPLPSPFRRASLLVLTAALTACGSQDVNSGNPTRTTPTTTTSTTEGTGTSTSTGTTTGDAGAGGHAATAPDAGAGGTHVGLADVQLVYGATTVTVDVATLPTKDYKGSQVVPLSTVWSAGKLGPGTAKLWFDFEGDDGYHPSMKNGCENYVPGADLPQGYILPDTRSVFWDDALGLFGCYNVHSVAKIIGLDVAK